MGGFPAFISCYYRKRCSFSPLFRRKIVAAPRILWQESLYLEAFQIKLWWLPTIFASYILSQKILSSQETDTDSSACLQTPSDRYLYNVKPLEACTTNETRRSTSLGPACPHEDLGTNPTQLSAKFYRPSPAEQKIGSLWLASLRQKLKRRFA